MAYLLKIRMKRSRSVFLLDTVMKYSLDMICTIDADGCFREVSEASRHILGYDSGELEGKQYLSFVHPEDRAMTAGIALGLAGGEPAVSFTNRYIHKSGAEVWLTWSAVWSCEEGLLFCIARVSTEANFAKQELHVRAELYNALLKHEEDMLALLDSRLNYKYVGGTTLKELGYAPEQLLGSNAKDFIHPEDVPKVQASLIEVLESEGSVSVPHFRFRNAKGEWRWVETVVSNRLADASIGALVANSRDITEQKAAAQKLQESELRFRALFDNNPDTVLVENREGIVLDVNRAGEALLQLKRHQVIGRPLACFLPPSAASVCLEHLRTACCGEIVKFVLEIEEGPESKVLEVTKIPVSVDGEVVAVHSVIKDITAVNRYHSTVRQHADKLNTIFDSITDGFFILDRDWNFAYINREAERLLSLDRKHHMGKNAWREFPAEVSGEFFRQYHHAVETGKAVHFEAYYGGTNRWVEVKAFPSEEGLSIYFDDITEKMSSRQELEKLSLVASKTTNGVIITDRMRRIEWVNEGFTKLTGYCLEEAVGKRPSELLHNHTTDTRAFESVSDKMMSGEPVSFEILNSRKNGEEIWLSVQVNPIYDENGVLSKYITIQTDITQRVKSQQELEKLSLVASSTDNGVIITDADGLTEWVNEGFTRLTGYTLSETLGRKPGDLLQGPETNEAAVRVMRESLKQGIHFSAVLANYKKSGEKFWVSMDITPIYGSAGVITQFIAIQKDITFKMEAETNLLKMAQDLYAHNKDLEQFTYIVSHNLRAPVANALGFANLLTRIDKGTKVFDTSLANLKESVFRLDTVMKDMTRSLAYATAGGL
ncbi:PAS domain S-box protein [Pontibacter sp. 172403-2]|uniref:PAS domain-containing protein n=1 Tax=Pontibacter rufus TaxID=2791028 RepID=UPI0018AFB714|nr:PAS domain-containing protein [Pontibacter sp. 172403-2]MBF9251673.1 PAS domain S-box protein [Pontibacter sp. 172403-2]